MLLGSAQRREEANLPYTETMHPDNLEQAADPELVSVLTI